ncbi:phosphopantetheine-binding protein [Nocardia sp. NPDC049220]|uniref:acyl carrier protein n=1 Tax=Nocardia sp. NPDC049220 TaxID=3155273 RepID=UPI0033CC51D8
MTSNPWSAADIEDLRDLVARVLEVAASEFTEDTDFVDQFNVDSLLELELAARLERKYRIEIPAAEIATLTSLGHVRKLVDRLRDADSLRAESNN